MNPENTISRRTIHRLLDARSRAADRSGDRGGGSLLAIHPHAPSADELITPDRPPVARLTPNRFGPLNLDPLPLDLGPMEFRIHPETDR